MQGIADRSYVSTENEILRVQNPRIFFSKVKAREAGAASVISSPAKKMFDRLMNEGIHTQRNGQIESDV
jgi:hypothetical protein